VCRLLKVARSTLYYRPLPVSVDDLRLMRWLDDRREAAVRLQPLQVLQAVAAGQIQEDQRQHI
jgi:hypothetical protein